MERVEHMGQQEQLEQQGQLEQQQEEELEHFQPALCPCGEVLLDGLFTGVVRVRCRRHGCGKRVWVISDGQSGRVRTSLIDSAPRRMVA